MTILRAHFTLDRLASTPLHEQLEARIAARVADGTLRPGGRLPGARRLARELGVNRGTVVRAYVALRAIGVLDGRPGARFAVRRRVVPPPAPPMLGPEPLPAALPAARLAPTVPTTVPVQSASTAIRFDLATHVPDPRLHPHALVRHAFRRALSARSAAAHAGYADPRGVPALREVVARRLARYGIAVDPDALVITDGAQHAFDLVFRTLLRPGDELVVESPTYARVLDAARANGVHPVPVPMRSDGLDLAATRLVLRRRHATMLYTMPECHNPTGVSTDSAHREALLALAASTGTTILEDGFDEELQYVGPSALPLRALDAGGATLHVGTLSKLLAPGLRVGWVVAPPAIAEKLARARVSGGLSGNGITQTAVATMLRHDDFDRYVRRLQRTLRARRDAMIAGLTAHLPEWVSWRAPDGGYTFWLSWPPERLSEALAVAGAAARGVAVQPGHTAFARPNVRAHLRLSIAVTPAEEVAEACERLGAALREASRG